MEITMPALREISKAAASDLYAEGCKYASAYWKKRGRKKVLRAAKREKELQQ